MVVVGTSTGEKQTVRDVTKGKPMKSARKSKHYWLRFICGGVAGCCAKTVSAPLDRVKILWQVRSVHYDMHSSPLRVIREIARTESPAALFRGNSAQIVRIFPYSALSYIVHDSLISDGRLSWLRFPRLFSNHSQSDDDMTSTDIHKVTPLERFVAGATAGFVAVVATYPLDLVRARLASHVRVNDNNNTNINVNNNSAKNNNTGTSGGGGVSSRLGMRGVIRAAVEDGGMRSLYRGVGPTVAGILPYAGLNFTVFGVAREKGSRLWPGAESSTTFNLFCGGLAGAVSQTITYPLDVVRRRMQLDGCREFTSNNGSVLAGKSSWDVFWTVWRAEGPSAFYRGISINFMRVIPTVGVSFAVNEYLKSLVGVTDE